VAVLLNQGLVNLERVAQDGMRVRPRSGAARDWSGACRRHGCKSLRGELDADPQASQRRHQGARLHAAEQREPSVEGAHRHRAAQEARRRKTPRPRKNAKRTEPHASSTDPEARVMKMADGGFHPAYNVQFASQIIIGVEVSNLGSDPGQLIPMLDEVAGHPGQHR